MTPIDRAFIKAYTQQDAPTIPMAGPPSIEPDRETLVETPPPLHSEDAPQMASPTIYEPMAFQPSFQVDSFAWPTGCTRLAMLAADEVERLSDALIDGVHAGRHVVAVGGCRQGDGCTTLLLCAARRLAERGLKVALVDADFANPWLARRLGLLPEAGWEELAAGRLPIEEVAIESIQDELVVLPLCGTPPRRESSGRDLPDPVANLNVLRDHYDLVLVDLGCFGDLVEQDHVGAAAALRWVDAVLLVHNVRSVPPDELDQTRHRMQAAGLAVAGVAENFVGLRRSA